MSAVRVFLVDDHAILREGLRALIDVQPDLSVVGDAADGQSALDAVAALRPDVVVMDISMPRLGGAEATEQIKRASPEVRVLALTAHEDAAYIQLLLRAGASGYLLKRAAATDLIKAIRAVAQGHVYLDTTTGLHEASASEASTPTHVTHDLSDREAEVLRMIALGYSMKRIAASLELSPRTLETYKMRAMAKLQLTNRADVVRFALQQGWLKDG
jgi:DNA-binding NarL/FixJ family response regulator